MIFERRNFNNNIGISTSVCVCVLYQNRIYNIILRYGMIINIRRIQVSGLHHWNYPKCTAPMVVMVARRFPVR